MKEHPHYRDLRGYKYQLTEPYIAETGIRPKERITTGYIDLDVDGRLVIAVGYAWDGPSGPTFDTPDFMRGALCHDALYQLLREGRLPPKYRKPIDKLLRRMCAEDGMPLWRRWYVYQGVRTFGGAFADG